MTTALESRDNTLEQGTARLVQNGHTADCSDNAQNDAADNDQPPSSIAEMRSIGTVAWPIAISVLSRLSMLTVDVACLGHIGTTELAAASMASVWCQAVTSFMSGAAFVLNTLCAQAWGAKNYELVGVWLQISILVMSVLCPLAFVAMFFTGSVLKCIGANEEVQELGSVFGRISILWVWPNLVYLAMRMYFQAQDIVRPAMYVNLVFVAVNLVLNLTFIWGIPGVFSGFGFRGSPMATAVSRWLQLVAFLIYVRIHKLHSKTWAGWQWHQICSRTRMREFLVQAFPRMFVGVLGASWDQLTTLIAAALGMKTLAEQSGMGTLLGPLFSIPIGINYAIQLRIGQHLGAKRPLSACQTWKSGLSLMLSVCIVFGVVFLACAPFLGRIFSDDADVIKTSMRLAPILCLIFFLVGLSQANCAALEGQARQMLAVVILVLGHGFTNVPITFLLCFIFHWGLFGIWWGQAFGEILCVVLTVVVVRRSDWVALSEDAVQRSGPAESQSDEPCQGAISLHPTSGGDPPQSV